MQLRNVPGSLLLAVSFSVHKREYFPNIFKKSSYFATGAFSNLCLGMVNHIGFKQVAGSQTYQRCSLGNMNFSYYPFFNFFMKLFIYNLTTNFYI